MSGMFFGTQCINSCWQKCVCMYVLLNFLKVFEDFWILKGLLFFHDGQAGIVLMRI